MKDFVRSTAILYRLRILRWLVPFAVVAALYWTGRQELRSIDLGRTLHTFRSLPRSAWLPLAGFSLLAVASMSGYDYLIRRVYKLPLTLAETFRYAWIANSSNNAIGMAGLTGAGLRALLYRQRGVPLATAALAVGFLSPVTLTGLSLLAWLGIAGALPPGPVLGAHPLLRYAIWGVALYLPLFALFQKSALYAKWFRRSEGRMKWSVIAASVGASFIEWLMAGLAFWLIASYFHHALPLPEALGLYVAAAIAGIVSLAPGGIGGFDLTALLGLQLLGFDASAAAAALVAFRLFYYLIPWVAGLLMAAFEFAAGRGRDANKQDKEEEGWTENALNAWQKLWSFPGRFGFIGEIGAWSLGKLVFAGGVLLLLSAATPGLLNRLHFSEEILSIPLMKLSLTLSVVVGILLIVLSRGISLRIKRAYRWTFLLLLAGAAFTFLKAFDFEEALFLLIVAVLLWISRDRFYRVGVPFSRELIARWGVATVLIVWLYDWVAVRTHAGYIRHLPPGADIRWFFTPQEHRIAIALGIGLAWLLLSLLWLFRPLRMESAGAAPGQLRRLESFLAGNRGNLLTHMLFAGDKSFFWAAEDRILIPYARVRNKLVVLGDPIGPAELASVAIQQFQQYADQYAMKVVIYQASPAYLPVYHENGYRFFKLGEEAIVPLAGFTLSGKRNTNLRTVKNRFDREGCTFEVLSPPFAPELLRELKTISDAWLKKRREKGFSLGWFRESYLRRAPIAVVRDPRSRIIAFASLAPGYDGETMSIDLMRHLPDTPNGTMDLLFIGLLEWAKMNGYARFNLGMAPLASVGQREKAMKEEKLAGLVFQYGGYWYGFEGLRKYKTKFSPEWEPRYLAYPSGTYLPAVLLELIRLIARRPVAPSEEETMPGAPRVADGR